MTLLAHIGLSQSRGVIVRVKSLLRIERSQLRWFGPVPNMPQERSTRQVLLAAATGK